MNRAAPGVTLDRRAVARPSRTQGRSRSFRAAGCGSDDEDGAAPPLEGTERTLADGVEAPDDAVPALTLVLSEGGEETVRFASA